MTPRRPSPFDRSLPVRLLLGLCRVCASLQLAVVLIAVLAVVLAWATYVESQFGTPAVQFGIYGTWWFLLLGALLGVNVLCSALVRLPWKARHTGFLLTHAGILVLLFGCLATWYRGIDGSIPLLEEADPVHRVYLQSQHFALSVQDTDGGKARTIRVPFRAGVFNWSEYGERFWFPWQLASRHQAEDVLYDRDQIRLQVLDYYSDSSYVAAPVLKLLVGNPATARASRSADEWNAVTLGVTSDIDPDPRLPNREKYGFGQDHSLSGDVRVTFWMTGSAGEKAAFLNSRPEGPTGDKGQVALWAGGRKHHLAVDQFDTTTPPTGKPRPRFPLEATDLEVSVEQFDPEQSLVKLRVHAKDGPPGELWLYATDPHRSQQDYENEVFGTYWFDPAAAGAMMQAQPPRIDVLLSGNSRLYYRTWRDGQVGEIAPLPADGSITTAWPETGHSVEFAVDELIEHDTPGRLIPQAFVKPNQKTYPKLPQVLVRLTVDGIADEFWLAGRMMYPLDEPPQSDQRRAVQGKRRRVTIELQPDEVALGFSIDLRDFLEEMYAGTGMERNYSSQVDVFSREDPGKRLVSKGLITMNVPMDFADPASGRAYRLSQQGRMGPWEPSADFRIEELVDDQTQRSRIYVSVLGANSDPGRGTKYFGSMMIVAGVLIVLCRRISRAVKTDTRGKAKGDT
ncbi:MAG: hypothetical protein HQ567_18305 [Candidatus Nealsonbacteria bacterium]|nr:hypothetical protein [Candidatus Nealsonbacteria bacterium]